MSTIELFNTFIKQVKEQNIKYVKCYPERDLNDDVLKIYLERSTMTTYNNSRCMIDHPIIISLTKRLNINDIQIPIYSVYFNVQGNVKDHNESYKHITIFNFYETTLKYSLETIIQHFFEYFQTIKPVLYSGKK